MRKYRNDAATPVRTAYGVELCAGLRVFPESAPLAPTCEQINDNLHAAYADRCAKQKPLAEARANMRFAAYQVAQAVRVVAREAEIADGGRKGGPLSEELFPEGLKTITKVGRTRQLRSAVTLVKRMKKSKLAAAAPFAVEQLPALEAAVAALTSAEATYNAANDAYLDAFNTEVALRNEHLRCVDKVMGQVRALFPRDKAKQDVVFPVVEDRAGERDPGIDEGEAEDAGAAEEQSAQPA